MVIQGKRKYWTEQADDDIANREKMNKGDKFEANIAIVSLYQAMIQMESTVSRTVDD